MILLHFDKAAPTEFWFLSVPDLALAVMDTGTDTLVPVERPRFTPPTADHLSAFIAAFDDLAGPPPANPRLAPSTRKEIPDWIFFADLTAKHQFILHTTSPVFLSPMIARGEVMEVLHPIADSPHLDGPELEHWLDQAHQAAADLLLEMAKSLGVP
jgi:hypothetical protein